MSFVIGLLKTASLNSMGGNGGNHNDGSQFVTHDTEPAVHQPNAGGMAPSGLEIYNPSGKEVKYKGSTAKKGLREATRLAMGKMARSEDLASRGQSQGASTLASQLKWESTTPGSLMLPGSDPESEQQYRNIQKSKKNGGRRHVK